MSARLVVLVCGGRHYSDSVKVFGALDAVNIRKVIHGGANGADQIARQWATVRGVECVEYVADWKRHGRAAGPVRNQQMLDDGKPDLVMAFPGGRGTSDMVRRARLAGVVVVEVK